LEINQKMNETCEMEKPEWHYSVNMNSPRNLKNDEQKEKRDQNGKLHKPND
jgi:hypothetical protein